MKKNIFFKSRNFLKKLCFCLIFLVSSIAFSQEAGNSSKKLNATIAHFYQNHESPIQIKYKIYPFGGSGKYEYRWRIKGEGFKEFGENDTHFIVFDCTKEKRPEVNLICQIRDKETGKVFTVPTVHPVEFCIKNNK